MRIATTRAAPATLWLVLAGLAFLPFLEFATFFYVAGRIGIVPALLALVATSFLGASLLRRQGGASLVRLVAAFRRGEPPTGAARESFLVAIGGFLMILPGFVTDIIGFGLILPSLVRTWRDGSAVAPRGRSRRPAADPQGRVIDLVEGEWSVVEDRRRSP
jgi:UPF0716 protein FxsA